MRVIGGSLRSRNLKTLKGNSTRPTSDKIKGAIFSSIAFEKNLNTMLDLFSGSGSMGIEAISRGFDHVIFNDLNRDAVNIIKQNIKDLDIKKHTEVYNLDYKKCLDKIEQESIDFLFIDPPYATFDLNELMTLVIQKNILSDHAVVVVEKSVKESLNENIDTLIKSKEKKYKDTTVTYYRRDVSL